MKFFSKIMLTLASLMAGNLSVYAAYTAPGKFDPSGFTFKGTRHTAFNTPRQQRISEINDMLRHNRKQSHRIATNQITPNITLGPTSSFGDLDGPNNEIWFYSSKFVFKGIPQEAFVDYIMLEYTFDIYDSNMKFVGSIHDKVRYQEDEVRIAGSSDSGCMLTPVVTKHFFNDDDKYEIIVGLVLNSTTQGYNHSRNLVYSLGGEKETLSVEDPETGKEVSKEFDKPINIIYSSIGDVLDASVDGEENYYITTYGENIASDSYWDDENMTADQLQELYWKQIESSTISFQVYGKADKDGNLTKIYEESMPILAMPGNQESTPFMMSFMHDNKPYFVSQRYKDIFWNPYYSPTDDLTMKESNSLLINIYRLDGDKAVNVSSTDLAFTKSSGDILASFYSIGDMRYREDINFGSFDFNKDGSAAFFITNEDLITAESGITNYYVYDVTGKRRKVLMRSADSTLALSDIPGYEPQQVFVQLVGSEYLFNMVDLYSGSKVASFSYHLPMDDSGEEYESLTSNMDRIKEGDSYIYMAESGLPLVDDNDNNLLGIVKIDKNGIYLGTEYANFGTSLQYAQLYIDASSLNPHIYDADDVREYMALIKYPIDENTTEEHVIISKALCSEYPEGKEILRIAPCEKGIVSGIVPYFTSSNPMLLINWSSENGYTQDVYYMPLGSSAVAEIESDGNLSGISFDGTTLRAEGQIITVYNLQGMAVATGFSSVSTADLAPGIYVATANGKACKFTK